MFKTILLWLKNKYKSIYYCPQCDVKLERVNTFLDTAVSLKYKYRCPNCGMKKSIRAR
tara:strand:+ start:123 stop:296 length:174 start_codon:yes stop_codon:yes gene_type:complete